MSDNFREVRILLSVAGVLVAFPLFSSKAGAVEHDAHLFDRSSAEQINKDDQSVGSEFRACSGCPIFVRVPEPPAGSRKITHVAKFELTWNQYLVAYDAGICPLPSLTDKQFREFQVNPSGELFNELRRDYAISNLGLSELNCYVKWLNAQTGGSVRLPSYLEWEWFARSGHPDRKFPWGNDEDPTREALVREEIRDILSGPDVNRVNNIQLAHIILGTRVGLFPPTEWGLYDVFGNVPELTDDVIEKSNIDVYRKELGVKINPIPPNSRLRIIKGELLEGRSEYWRDGISKIRFVSEVNGRFSFTAGVRLVIEGG